MEIGKKAAVAMLTLICSVSIIHAQTVFNEITSPGSELRLYTMGEWLVSVNRDFANPYDQKEVKLDMVLHSPSGVPLVLPCFYDKEKATWCARFTPRETGPYRGYFRLSTRDTSYESSALSFVSKSSSQKGFLNKNDHWTFRFDNGSLFRGIGENVAWESRSFENEKWTYDYLLPRLASNGANFFRTWMCYWNLPLEWKKVSNTKRYQDSDDYFNPGAIRRMDELLSLCDSLDLYLMLTIDWHGHLMERGGWKNSNYNAANGGAARTPGEFFSLQQASEQYRNKLRYIVARWGYSTNIAAWEFFNEVDNAAFTQDDSLLIDPAAITQWHLEMSRYLKDIDPYQHLVTTSVSHRDIVGMNSIPYIDFNQKHIYKHTEKIPAIYPAYIETFGKPYVVGEFGYRWEDQDPRYAREANFDFQRGLWFGLFSKTPILPMSWWWELFDDQNMIPYFQSVRTVSDEMLKAGNGSFIESGSSAGNLWSQAVKCGNTWFIYLLNNSDTLQASEIKVEGITSPASIRSFDPATRTYTSIRKLAVSLQAKAASILIVTEKKRK